MNYETLVVRALPRQRMVTLSRPGRNNSINSGMIRELGSVLDEAEGDPACRMVVIEGAPGVFCTGMDFQEVAGRRDVAAAEAVRISEYMALLRRFTLSPKVVIARVDGRVIAGGVGLVAASDLVLATGRSEFSLSEALWGLLPCCVIPFLIRRVGFQKAYAMTLTTRPVSAAEAQTFHLVDEVTPNPDESLRRLGLRLNLLEEETLGDLKRYFRRMWMLTEDMERHAVEEITRLASLPRVQRNIATFVESGVFPWERRGSEA